MRLPVTTHEVGDASTSELVNCYIEQLPADARAPYILKRTHGVSNALGTNGNNLLNWPQWLVAKVSDKKFAVVGGELNQDIEAVYYFDNNGVTVTQAGIGGSGMILRENLDWAINSSGYVLVSEPNAAQGTGTLNPITDADFTSRGAGDVEFLDNYLIFREPGSGRFFSADLGSRSAFTSTNFATAEESPDVLVGMKSDRGQLILFGEQTAEVWDATGGTGFPFRSTINGAINKGCINGRTIALVDGRIYWIADDLTVRVLNGLDPVKVSNFAIDQEIAKDDSITSPRTRAFGYAYDGHNYLVIRSLNNCWAYDIDTGAWHKRKSQGSDTWRFIDAVTLGNSVFFADNTGSTQNPSFTILAKADRDWYKEGAPAAGFNDPLVMQWTYQPVWDGGGRLFHDRLEIVVETGVGNENEDDPILNLEYSDDGGSQWHAAAKRTMGGYGEDFQRVVWHNLGASYKRIYRASVSDPVPVTVVDNLLNARRGRQ